MRVILYEPPEGKRIGGLDVAIRSLERQLRSAGVDVVLNPPELEHDDGDGTVVHFHGMWEWSFARLAARCRKLGIPYVVSPHGMLEPWAFRHKAWKKRPYFYAVERPMLKGARCLVATSDLEAAHLRQYTGHVKVSVIPLAVSTDMGPDYEAARERLGWKPDERIMLFLSRIHPKKGLHLLLEALERIESDLLRGVRLVVVGDGEEAFVRRLKERSKRLSCKVHWVGPVWGDEKWSYLQGADLFCLPTYSENFGLAVQEACQVGTPVLTTYETPWAFLSDWGGGLIVRPETEDIGAALETFLKEFVWSFEQRIIFADRTHRHFDPDRITKLYLDTYSEVLSHSESIAI